MKRKADKILALLFAVLLVVSLPPLCGVTALADDEETDYCYLSYYLDVNDEASVGSQEVVKGTAPVKIEDPGREGMTFMGWYTDKDLTVPFDFSEPMYADTDIYAKFGSSEDTVGVCFFMGPDEEYPYADQILTKGELVQTPVEPFKGDDMVFAGWYSDRGLENKYDFSQPVEDYLYLFARFVSEDDCYTIWVYLDAEDETPVIGFSAPKGDPCPVPAEPGREDAVFSGWYTDRTLTEPADFTAPRSEDISLFPKWTKDSGAPEGSADMPNPFTDVKEGDYFYEPVRWAYYHEPQVTNGMTDTTFGPDLTVTRGQCVTFLWRAMGRPAPAAAANPFTDVSADQYYYEAVLWAVEKGITNGVTDTTFAPDMTLSTAHITTFLYRTLGVGSDGWYQEAADWADADHLLDSTDLTVAPGEDCPRGAVVTFLYREMARL